MGGWLTGLGAGAQGLLGQRAANQEAGFKAQNFALDQATTRIQQQNALLEQQRFQQAQADAQAKQAAMEALRAKNIQIPVGNGQSINLADARALGLGPKDFAPPSDKLTYKTIMINGKPYRESRNLSVPNSPWVNEGEAPPAPSLTAGDKPQLVHGEEGLTTFVEPMTASGKVVGPRVITGHKPLPATLQAKVQAAEDAYELAKAVPSLVAALGPLDKIDPNTVTKQAALFAYSGHPWELNIAHRVYGPTDDNYGNLFAQLGQIQASLSKAYFGGRPSQQLFQLLSQHMPNPGDSPQDILRKIKSLTGPSGTLQTQINNIVQRSRQEAEAAAGGGDSFGSPALEGGAAPSGGGDVVQGLWHGVPMNFRKTGDGKWERQDSSGGWVPYNG